MEIYAVKVTKQAREQMTETARYISKTLCNPEAAQNLVDEIEKTIGTLDKMPHRIKQVEWEPWKSLGIRMIMVHNFYVYFWINEENLSVQVMAIIYEKRNQIEQLKTIEL